MFWEGLNAQRPGAWQWRYNVGIQDDFKSPWVTGAENDMLSWDPQSVAECEVPIKSLSPWQ